LFFSTREGLGGEDSAAASGRPQVEEAVFTPTERTCTDDARLVMDPPTTAPQEAEGHNRSLSPYYYESLLEGEHHPLGHKRCWTRSSTEKGRKRLIYEQKLSNERGSASGGEVKARNMVVVTQNDNTCCSRGARNGHRSNAADFREGAQSQRGEYGKPKDEQRRRKGGGQKSPLSAGRDDDLPPIRSAPRILG